MQAYWFWKIPQITKDMKKDDDNTVLLITIILMAIVIIAGVLWQAYFG